MKLATIFLILFSVSLCFTSFESEAVAPVVVKKIVKSKAGKQAAKNIAKKACKGQSKQKCLKKLSQGVKDKAQELVKGKTKNSSLNKNLSFPREQIASRSEGLKKQLSKLSKKDRKTALKEIEKCSGLSKTQCNKLVKEVLNARNLSDKGMRSTKELTSIRNKSRKMANEDLFQQKIKRHTYKGKETQARAVTKKAMGKCKSKKKSAEDCKHEVYGALVDSGTIKPFFLKKSSRASKLELPKSHQNTVIGKVDHLTPHKLKPNEKSLLSKLPNQHSAKENWRQNSMVLRNAMRSKKPIRDASRLFGKEHKKIKGSFTNAERNLLRVKGWQFDKNTGYWCKPPEVLCPKAAKMIRIKN